MCVGIYDSVRGHLRSVSQTMFCIHVVQYSGMKLYTPFKTVFFCFYSDMYLNEKLNSEGSIFKRGLARQKLVLGLFAPIHYSRTHEILF
jgi:hypothetical protein